MTKIVALHKSRGGKVLEHDAKGGLVEGLSSKGVRYTLRAWDKDAASAVNALVSQGTFADGAGSSLLETEEKTVYVKGSGEQVFNVLSVNGVPSFEVGGVYSVTEEFVDNLMTAINKAKSISRLKAIRTSVANVLGITVAQFKGEEERPFPASAGMDETLGSINGALNLRNKQLS